MGKKQKWFFENAKQMLEELRDVELRDELERRQLRMVFHVSYADRVITFAITDTMKGDELVWSSLAILSIVDFDIALEHLREWMKKPDPIEEDGPELAPLSSKTPDPGICPPFPASQPVGRKRLGEPRP